MKDCKEARSKIKTLNYIPHKCDLNSFLLFADCNSQEIQFKDVNLTKSELDVYALQFGDDLYVGSSSNLKTRISQHFRELKSGTHPSKRVQKAYDANNGFKVFILMRCQPNARYAEQLVIRLLNPSLNAVPPHGSRELYNNFIWGTTQIGSV